MELAGVSGALTFTLDRFDGYWNKSHVYPAKYVEPSVVNETTRLAGVKTGQFDFSSISAETYPAAIADKNLQTRVAFAAAPYVLFMNNKHAPLNNPQVRQAISLAVNRDALSQSQSGLCKPETQAIPEGFAGNIPSYNAPAQNVAEAKQLIQQAGATGATLTLVDTSFAPYYTFGDILQAQLDAIGLNIKINELAPGTERVPFQNGNGDLLMAPTSLSIPDPTFILDTYVDGLGNPGTKNPALQAEIQHAETLSIGSSARAQALQAINRELLSPADMVWVPLCRGANILAANKNVIGLQTEVQNLTFTTGANWSYLQVAK
jgi:ABC-type transport system substrate-binding protein